MTRASKLETPWRCQECGRRYLTLESATRALAKGCKCGGYDIDEDAPKSAVSS